MVRSIANVEFRYGVGDIWDMSGMRINRFGGVDIYEPMKGMWGYERADLLLYVG